MSAVSADSYFVYATPLGRISIAARGNRVVCIVFGAKVLAGVEAPTECTNAMATQVLEFLAGKRRSFDVAFAYSASAFRRQVFGAVRDVPFGTTATCSDIAHALDAASPQAVGKALRENVLPFIVPDHRIVDEHGIPSGDPKLVRIKQHLLSIEQEARL